MGQGLSRSGLEYKYKRINESSLKYPHGFVEKGKVYSQATRFGINYYYHGYRRYKCQKHEEPYHRRRPQPSGESSASSLTSSNQDTWSDGDHDQDTWLKEEVWAVLSCQRQADSITYHYYDDQDESHYGRVETNHSITVLSGQGYLGHRAGASGVQLPITTTFNQHKNHYGQRSYQYTETQALDNHTLASTTYHLRGKYDDQDKKVMIHLSHYHRPHCSEGDYHQQYHFENKVHSSSWLLILVFIVIIILIIIWVVYYRRLDEYNPGHNNNKIKIEST